MWEGRLSWDVLISGQLIPSQVDLAVTGRMTNMSCTPSPPTTITNGNVTQEVVKEEPFIIPNVVKELYNRIDSKVGAVVGLQGVTDNVREQLLKVIEGDDQLNFD